MSDSANPGPGAQNGPGDGLVWAFQFSPDGTATPIGQNAIAHALTTPSGWVWLHFALADTRGRAWLSRSAPVSQRARENLVGPDEHLHLDVVGSEIIGTIPDLHREFDREGEDIARLRFVMTERLLISARRTPLHAVELTRRSIESGQRCASAMALIDSIMDQFADAISVQGQRFGDELEEVEHRLMQEGFSDERQRLGRVRLQTARVQRQLGHVRTLFHRLEPRLGPEAQEVAAAVRALALKLDSVEHEMAALYERAHLMHDELTGKMAAITNRRLFTLSILNACLLPPTLVTGFFGMNTKDLPFQNTESGTWLAASVALAVAATVFLVLRRQRAL